MITEALALYGLYTLAGKVLPKTFSLQEKVKSWLPKLPVAPEPSNQVKHLCAFMNDHYAEWEYDSNKDDFLSRAYIFMHRERKIRIWIANDDCGIDLHIDGTQIFLSEIDKETIWNNYRRIQDIIAKQKLEKALSDAAR